MAGMAMPPGFPSIQPARRAVVVQSPCSSRVFIPITPRHFRYQASANDEASCAYNRATDAAKKGAEAAQKAGKDVKDRAAAATGDQVGEKAKEAAGKASETAQDLTEKAKQTAHGAWETVKDTTQKIKETVVGKTGETKEAVKDSAENVKRNLNSKI
ncbi:hypothetical protein QQ045_008180 [Rhodiola kirilowii]